MSVCVCSGTFFADAVVSQIQGFAIQMSNEQKSAPAAARVRLIYAMDRINQLMEKSGDLPEETIALVVSCVNAISDVVDRRITLDSESSHVADYEAHARASVG